jgi:16S rRNA (uracil1498-N3)-methyltransferase
VTRRFYVEPGTLVRDDATLSGPLARRLANVLRLRPGEEIALFDGAGTDARARVETVSAGAVAVRIVDRMPSPAEKLTEIGVSRIVPLVCARAVVRPDAGGAKAGRWRRIAIEAAEQCGRGAVPLVDAPEPFDAAVRGAQGVILLPYEGAGPAAPGIGEALNAAIDAVFARAAVDVFIGPEGGLTPEEVALAQERGAMAVTLGDRILRSETAGLVAATLAMSALGELG